MDGMGLPTALIVGLNVVALVVHYVALSSRISRLEVKVCHLWKQHEGAG